MRGIGIAAAAALALFAARNPVAGALSLECDLEGSGVLRAGSEETQFVKFYAVDETGKPAASDAEAVVEIKAAPDVAQFAEVAGETPDEEALAANRVETHLKGGVLRVGVRALSKPGRVWVAAEAKDMAGVAAPLKVKAAPAPVREGE